MSKCARLIYLVSLVSALWFGLSQADLTLPFHQMGMLKAHRRQTAYLWVFLLTPRALPHCGMLASHASFSQSSELSVHKFRGHPVEVGGCSLKCNFFKEH